MAFAEDIVKNETTADECTVIMRELFHEYIQEKKHESILERLKPIQKQNKETGGEST
jgi:flagellar biosynthesis component FlhA